MAHQWRHRWLEWHGERRASPRSKSVLVRYGAAGGVGVFAVQLAHWAGAHVIATASARNRDFLHELGANEIIDYTTTRFEDGVYVVHMYKHYLNRVK